MRGLEKSYMKRGQTDKETEGQTSRLYERIAQGPVLLKHNSPNITFFWHMGEIFLILVSQPSQIGPDL